MRLRFESVVLIVALLGIAVLALYGCATPTNSVVMGCLPLKTWTAADQDELLKEYNALPPGAIMRDAFKDYMAQRDADRVCIAAAK